MPIDETRLAKLRRDMAEFKSTFDDRVENNRKLMQKIGNLNSQIEQLLGKIRKTAK